MKSTCLQTVLLFCFSALIGKTACAQNDSTAVIQFSGYVETYWGYDLDDPADNRRPEMVYNHHRHNEINVNLAYIKASYAQPNRRANLALMAGTYASANLSAEPDVIKNIFEANVGIKIFKKTALWLDAGILPSHIGFESAVGKDCWTLTRSLSADNTPYYESGARLSWASPDGRWYLAAFALNGWQQIVRPDSQNGLAFGTQALFKPSKRITLNYSTYLGDRPGTNQYRRFFNNFYGVFQLTKQFGITAGLDAGMDRIRILKSAGSDWLSLTLVARYAFSDRWAVAARGEYFQDELGAVIAGPSAFDCSAISLNIDFSPAPNTMLRIEGKSFQNRTPFFVLNDGRFGRYNSVVTAVFAVAF